ncbi:MAG: hypothetical protein QXE50_05720 [Nitrososphaerota archaeon]
MSEFDASRVASSITGQPHEIVVYRKETWGTHGQHDNLYTFVIDIETKTVKSIFEYEIMTRREIRDSRKNFHRETFMPLTELERLDGKIIMFVNDYASSAKRRVTKSYYKVDGKAPSLIPLESESGIRDSKGFFDYVRLPDGGRIKVYRDTLEVE